MTTRYEWREEGSLRFGLVMRREAGYLWMLRYDGFVLSGETVTEDEAMTALATAIKTRRLYRRHAKLL